MGIGSSSLLARKWIHVATEYLIKLMKDIFESYDIIIFLISNVGRELESRL